MSLKVKLVAHGDENTCALAALTCTSEEEVTKIFEENKQQLNVLDRVYQMGHESVIEHMWFTFVISGISRACSHQLVRTRLASYSQKSQRYVPEGGFECVVPPSIEALGTHAVAGYNEVMTQSQYAYDMLLSFGVPAEDARFVLPNAAATQLVMTLNARTFLNFLAERECSTAQWEIKAMAEAMHKAAEAVSPTLMKYAGPKCIKAGVCKEWKQRWEKCKRAPHAADVVTITKAELESLQDDAHMLQCYESAGVDNWDGRDYAIDLYNGEEE